MIETCTFSSWLSYFTIFSHTPWQLLKESLPCCLHNAEWCIISLFTGGLASRVHWIGLYCASGCVFRVYCINLNLWSAFNNAVTQKDFLTFNTIYPRPPSCCRETEMLLFACSSEYGAECWKTHRNWLSLWAHCQARMFAIICNYTDRWCTSSCWRTPVNVAGRVVLLSLQPRECHKTVMNDTSSPSCSLPAEHPLRLLHPDVWQLHAAHVLLRLLTRLHLGELHSDVLCAQSLNVLRFIESVEINSAWSMYPVGPK